MTELQYDLIHSVSLDTDQADQHRGPQAFEPLDALVEGTIRAIEAQMADDAVILIASSYGKDSTCVLACTLEAGRRHLHRTGVSPVIRVSTIDTLVDNPIAMGLSRQMARRMQAWAAEQGLDAHQVWAKPKLMDRYLVQMLGGRSIASVAGGDASCAVDLKIRPVKALKTQLKREFPGRKIITLLGSRYSESVNRSESMRFRGERHDLPVLNEEGDWLLSPIAHWELGHVWGFIDRVVGGEPPFPVFDDLIGLASLYEMAGESTCSTDAFSGARADAGMGCGSSGRMGCWACAKTSDDHSLVQMLEHRPEFSPLVQLSRFIRAGHFVPANRSFVARSIDSEGRVRIAGNAYSPQWCQELLRLALTVDQQELDWAAEQSHRQGRTVKPRFRVVTDEELVAISFMWGRYGLNSAQDAMAIAADVRLMGNRYALSDQRLQELKVNQDRAACSRTYGYLQVMTPGELKMLPTQGRIDILAEFAGDDSLLVSDGKGVTHSSGLWGTSEITVTLGDDPDLAMWHLMDRALEGRSSGVEAYQPNHYFNFLLRQGVIRLPAGYMGRLRDYSDKAIRLRRLKLAEIANCPDLLLSVSDAERDGDHSGQGDLLATC